MTIHINKQDIYQPSTKPAHTKPSNAIIAAIEKPTKDRYINYTVFGNHTKIDRAKGPVLSSGNTIHENALAIKETTDDRSVRYYIKLNVDGRLYNPFVGNVRRPLKGKNQLIKVTSFTFFNYLKFLSTTSLSWLKIAESEALNG